MDVFSSCNNKILKYLADILTSSQKNQERNVRLQNV